MLEIEELLEPIDEALVAGPDLRLDPADLTFQTLKDFTKAVDPAVAADEDDVGEPNWNGVVGLCISALREKSKDLELITALAGAWVRTEGIPGIEQGLGLLQLSLEKFWDQIHPGIDPDDGEISLALRARWLNWMDTAGGYVEAVKRGPILAGEGGASYCWADHKNSALLDDATLSPERHQELIDAGVVGDAEWTNALGKLSNDDFRALVASLERAREIALSLVAFCEERFGDEEAPAFYNVRSLLDEMHAYLSDQIAEAEPEAGVWDGAGASGRAGGVGAAGGALGNRQEALRQLQAVGDFFRRTEPHSPISYLIARAVKWGAMPLDQLFKDVVRNDDVIQHIWETLGLDGAGKVNEDD